jgi:hypothetical protein
MKDTSATALLGVLIGYLAHGFWPQIVWIVRMLTG